MVRILIISTGALAGTYTVSSEIAIAYSSIGESFRSASNELGRMQETVARAAAYLRNERRLYDVDDAIDEFRTQHGEFIRNQRRKGGTQPMRERVETARTSWFAGLLRDFGPTVIHGPSWPWAAARATRWAASPKIPRG